MNKLILGLVALYSFSSFGAETLAVYKTGYKIKNNGWFSVELQDTSGERFYLSQCGVADDDQTVGAIFRGYYSWNQPSEKKRRALFLHFAGKADSDQFMNCYKINGLLMMSTQAKPAVITVDEMGVIQGVSAEKDLD